MKNGRKTVIRIAIVEDDEKYIVTLKKYLEQYKEETGQEIEITVYHDGDEIAAFYRAQFDIILMDIEMKFIDGMTAAEEIRKKDTKVSIIFITNAPQYAIRGYEVGALDYILKPVPYFTFSQKLSRAVAKMEKRSRKWITIPVKGGAMRMDLSDVYYYRKRGAQSDLSDEGWSMCLIGDNEVGGGSDGGNGFLQDQQMLSGQSGACGRSTG